MKYVKLFEDFEDDEFENSLNDYVNKDKEDYSGVPTVTSAVENSLVELSDDGMKIDISLRTTQNTVGRIRISNPNRIDKKITDYKENINYLYDILVEYNYRIYIIATNSVQVEDDFGDKSFDYIWNEIVKSMDNKFYSIQFYAYKK